MKKMLQSQNYFLNSNSSGNFKMRNASLGGQLKWMNEDKDKEDKVMNEDKIKDNCFSNSNGNFEVKMYHCEVS